MIRTMIPGQYRSRTRVWALALAFSILLHLGGLMAVTAADKGESNNRMAPPSDIVEFVFAPQPTSSERPEQFTELPEDRTDEAPRDPDFLSNIDSRARDALPGGDELSLPHSEGRAETPQVAMAQDGDVSTLPEPTPKAEIEEARIRDLPLPSENAWTRMPDPLTQWRRAANAERDAEKETRPGVPESLYQPSMENPEGNAALVGEISLNTTAWVYGFWMQRFRRAVSRNWYAPYAFNIGLIHGWTFVELEIAPDGRLLRCDVLEEEGHTSLRHASVDAVTASAPYSPLPDDFPEESLIIRLKMIYERPRR